MINDEQIALLARLAATDGVEATLAAATAALVELTGATAAACRLEGGQEHWRGFDEVLLEQARPLLSAELADLEITRPDGERWLVSSLGPGERPLGVMVVCFDEKPGEGPQRSASNIAEILAAKLDVHRMLTSTQAELTQVKRWFDVLDSQMQVLDRERQKFVAVVSQSDTLMFVADGEHRARWANTALRVRLNQLGCERIAGLPVQELWDLLEVECPPSGSAACPIARVFREQEVAHLESRQGQGGAGAGSAAPSTPKQEGGAGGPRRALYLTLLPIKDKAGETAEVLVMIQDLSDLDVLRRSESRYRQLFESSPVALVITAPDTGNILLSNPAASELTGYPARELAGLTLGDLHEPDDWPPAREDYARMMKRGGVTYTERRLRSKLGLTMIVDVFAARFDLDGQTVTLLHLQDVTRQRQLEAELRHSQKMEAVGRLAAGITHEFNNLVTIILAQAERLKLRAAGDERLQDIADTTEKSAMRAGLLTRKLLAISRKEVVKDEVLDLNKVFCNIRELLSNLLGERVALHIYVGAEPCLVKGDRSQLEEIAINLAANARDAIMRDGNFRLEVSHTEEHVLLIARDDGIGMDEETKARVFEPFFTTKAAHAGTGLGMSTIARVVERHGGTIEVESEPSTGTCFTIMLPRAEAAGWKPPAEAVLEWGARGEECVLVVDDIAEVRRMAAFLLKLDGYEVSVAASADEALTMLEGAAKPFDLLLTDVVMPSMTGGELSQVVQERFPDVHILYMSGYTDDDVVQAGVTRSEAAFIRKPFTRKSLSQKVREVLDG